MDSSSKDPELAEEGFPLQLRQPVVSIITALVVTFAGATIAAAQGGPPEVGVPVVIVDQDGIIRGSVTVKELADPFSGHDPSSPPEEGTRYVSLTVTFEAAPDQSLDAQPGQLILQDGDGFLHLNRYVPRPADSQIPDLQAQLMAPDNRISGVVSYIIPAEAVLDRIIYQPASDRLIDLVDALPESGPALGDAISYTDATGATATITAQLIDPFTDNDPNNPPPEGARFVMLQPVFENSGALPYWVDPYDLYLRDAAGHVYTVASVYRPPGFSVPLLESQMTSPGDRLSGYVGYEVPADAELTDVLYYQDSSRFVTLADLHGGSSQPAQPAATAESPAPAGSPAPAEPAASPEPALPPASPAPDASAGTDR